MCLSIFLAQALGCYLFLVSLAMLVHQHQFKRIISDMLSNPSLITFAGCANLMFGLLIVVSHNIWVAMWPVLITIIGWLLIIHGVMRIFFPEQCCKVCKDLIAKTGYVVWCWIWLIVGLFLIWSGFSQM